MRIGKNFTLEELTRSATAARKGIPNVVTSAAIIQLQLLCIHVLDPLRALVGPVQVLSGYRSLAVNTAVGGARTSQHLTGNAADIIVPGMTVAQVVRKIRTSGIPFDQVIDEFGIWTHVSWAPNRRMAVLKARKVDGKTVYSRVP